MRGCWCSGREKSKGNGISHKSGAAAPCRKFLPTKKAPRLRFVRTADGVLARVEAEARVSDQGLEPTAVSRAQLRSRLFTADVVEAGGVVAWGGGCQVGQSVGWRLLRRRQLHGDGPIAQRGGPLRCWEGRVLGAVERRALAVERRSDSRESTRWARAPHTTSQRGFFPHEAGQITVGAAWWLCGCAVCAVAASFLDPLLEVGGGAALRGRLRASRLDAVGRGRDEACRRRALDAVEAFRTWRRAQVGSLPLAPRSIV